jgi:hypothetical protein
MFEATEAELNQWELTVIEAIYALDPDELFNLEG